MKILNSNRIKILSAMALSYFVAVFLTSNVFLGNTKNINPEFVMKLKSAPSNLIAFLKDKMAKSVQQNIAVLPSQNNPSETTKSNQVIFKDFKNVQPPQNLQYDLVSKGVRVATDPFTKKTYATFDQTVPFKTVEIEIDGKTYKAIVPQ